MKFSRTQEVALIELGLKTLINKNLLTNQNITKTNKKPEKINRKWSTAQRKKFILTMKKKWEEKNKK